MKMDKLAGALTLALLLLVGYDANGALRYFDFENEDFTVTGLGGGEQTWNTRGFGDEFGDNVLQFVPRGGNLQVPVTATLSGLAPNTVFTDVRIYAWANVATYVVQYEYQGDGQLEAATYVTVDAPSVRVDNTASGLGNPPAGNPGVATAPRRYYREVPDFMTDANGEIAFTFIGDQTLTASERTYLDGIAFDDGALASDFNGDTVADLSDFARIRDNFLEFDGVDTIATKADGDANEDGVVDFADYNVWVLEATPEAVQAASFNVPEPSTFAMLGLFATLACGLGRRRNS